MKRNKLGNILKLLQDKFAKKKFFFWNNSIGINTTTK